MPNDTLIRDEHFDLVEHLRTIPFRSSALDHEASVAKNSQAFTGLTAIAKLELKLSDYVDKSKAAIEVPVALAPQPLPHGFRWDMLANDSLGDCVIAMMIHTIETFFIAAGMRPPAFTAQDAISLYSAITGYDPADPSTDQGTDEGQALTYWQQTGISCAADKSLHKIAGAVAVDQTSRAERHLAMFEFDAVEYAIQLPLTWQGASSWTGVPSDSDPNSAPGSWGGHGVAGRAYDASGKEDIETWGEDLLADGDSLDAYLVQASIVVTHEMVNTKTGLSRCGISWDDLWADFAKLPQTPVQ